VIVVKAAVADSQQTMRYAGALSTSTLVIHRCGDRLYV